MEYRRLGASGLRVSVVCLGSMPFGTQVDEPGALRILDRAWDQGINLFDTAEMYASPPSADSYGRSEAILGRWLRTKPRDSVLIASKVAGPNDGMFGPIVPHIRGGAGTLDLHNITVAVEGSLRRLGTDYVDLYQTHWPDRLTPIEVQLDAFDRLVRSGKARYVGASNETPWGLARLAVLAKERGHAGPVSVQNVYNLLERQFEDGLAEVCLQEHIGMVAYSPLAMGVLTGKYAGGTLPEGTRLSMFERYRARYGSQERLAEAQRCARLAERAGLDPAQMAVAWVRERPGVTCVLSSCSRPDQVDSLVAAATLQLPKDVEATLGRARDEPPCGQTPPPSPGRPGVSAS